MTHTMGPVKVIRVGERELVDRKTGEVTVKGFRWEMQFESGAISGDELDFQSAWNAVRHYLKQTP